MNTGQAGDIGDLIEDAGIHRRENGCAGIDPCRDQHPGFFRRRNFPEVVVDSIDLHVRLEFHRSTSDAKNGLQCRSRSLTPTTYSSEEGLTRIVK